MLNEKERHIYRCLELQANVPLEQIAQTTGYRLHTVRHTVRRLEQNFGLQKTALISYSSLGLHRYSLAIALKAEFAEKKPKVLNVLAKSEFVIFIAEMTGDYQIDCCLVGENVAQASKAIDLVADKLEAVIQKKAMACQFSLDFYPADYLDPKGAKLEASSWNEKQQSVKLDSLDWDILYSLTSRNWRTFSDIAKSLGSPAASVNYRIKRLEKNGVIRGYYYISEMARSEYLIYSVRIQMGAVSVELHKRLSSYCANHPNIILLFRTFGSWDYEIVYVAAKASELVEATDDLRENFGQEINDIKSYSRLKYYKMDELPMRRN